jgi:hypothetical protein
VAIIAALHDPMTVLAADDFADMVAPDHDRADRRTARVMPVMRPGSRQVVAGAGIGTHLPAHVPSAPGPGPSAAPVKGIANGMMVVMSVSIAMMVPECMLVKVTRRKVMMMVMMVVP